ncbi:MAG: AMP-binding protein [Comamonas sp.]|nr:AMP-binding protein [Candidatus Comamonas equi]
MNILHQHAGTVAELILSSIQRYESRPAFIGDDHRITYGELGDLIYRTARYLDSLGLQPGDAVVQLATNRHEFFALAMALFIKGLVSVTLHATGSAADHAYIVNDCKAKVLIFDSSYHERATYLGQHCPGLQGMASFGDCEGHTNMLQVVQQQSQAPQSVHGDAETVIRLAYTGGTTGKPKGVMLSNRALLTNTLIDLAVKDLPEHIRYLCVAPITHGGGSMLLPTLARGGSVTLLKKFTPDAFFDALAQHRCNTTWMVPTMLYALLDHPRSRTVDWSHFDCLVYSAAPTIAARIREAMQVIGPKLVQSYGQTEAPNSIFILNKQDHIALSHGDITATGRASPFLSVSIKDDQGQPVAAGERGEVCVRGPLVMSGYYQLPDATQQALQGDWLHTGDVAYQDAQGFFHIVDRKKDMIISGGFNVYPKEVEDVIGAHPDVAAVAVVGLPDSKWGELVTACIVPKLGAQLDTASIQQLVRDAKGAVAAPKRVDIVDTLPLTALGKIDKKQLRLDLAHA